MFDACSGLSPLFINAQHVRAEYTEQALLAGLDVEGLLGLDNECRLLNNLEEQFGVQTAFTKVQPCCHVSFPSCVLPIRHLLVNRNTDSALEKSDFIPTHGQGLAEPGSLGEYSV